MKKKTLRWKILTHFIATKKNFPWNSLRPWRFDEQMLCFNVCPMRKVLTRSEKLAPYGWISLKIWKLIFYWHRFKWYTIFMILLYFGNHIVKSSICPFFQESIYMQSTCSIWEDTKLFAIWFSCCVLKWPNMENTECAQTKPMQKLTNFERNLNAMLCTLDVKEMRLKI